MPEYRKKAVELQKQVQEKEAQTIEGYNKNKVEQAIVHTREDLVLLVSYLDSLNNTNVKLLFWVRIIGFVFAYQIVIGFLNFVSAFI